MRLRHVRGQRLAAVLELVSCVIQVFFYRPFQRSIVWLLIKYSLMGVLKCSRVLWPLAF